MFLIKKIVVNAANYCAITNHDFLLPLKRGKSIKRIALNQGGFADERRSWYRPVKLDYFSLFSDLIVTRGLQADSGRGRH